MTEDSFLQEQAKLFGARIKFLRIKAGYDTQLSFAKAFTGENKKTSILSRIEHGSNIQFKTIIRLAQLLNVSLLNIFDFAGKHTLVKGNGPKPLEALIEFELKLLGQRIQHIRKAKKLIQLDIDAAGFIDRSNLSNYERGTENIKFFTIAHIAYILGVEVWELFDYEGKYNFPK